MITYEILKQECFSPVDLLIGIEQSMRAKKIISEQAEAKHMNADEIVFYDSNYQRAYVKVFLKSLYLNDLEMLEFEIPVKSSDLHPNHLVLIYAKPDYEIQTSLEGHISRVAELTGCSRITCYEYVTLMAGEERAIGLKETFVHLRPGEPDAPYESTETVQPHPEMNTNPLKSDTYDFYRNAALSREELAEFLELGVLSKKTSKSRVSVDL